MDDNVMSQLDVELVGKSWGMHSLNWVLNERPIATCAVILSYVAQQRKCNH